MSDERGQEMLRQAQAGDADAAAGAIAHGVRRVDYTLVSEALEAAVGSLDIKTLEGLLNIVADEIAARESVVLDGRERQKVGELHMPKLGNVSLGKLVSEVVSFVEKLQNGDAAAAELTSPNGRRWNWRSRTYTQSAPDLKAAEKLLEKADGIMVSSSAALRVYAIKPEDKAKTRKRLEKKAKEIERQKARLEKEQKEHEAKLKAFEAEKARLDKKMAAELKKLEEEKKKL